MEDVISRDITIGSESIQVYPDNKLHKILDKDGKTKYQFYENKKEGGTTKAWQQWQDFELKAGIRVVAGVREDAKEFTNKEGKVVPYKQRTIVYFEGDANGTPHMQETPVGDSKWKDDVEKRLADLEFEVFTPKGAKEEVNAEDLPF